MSQVLLERLFPTLVTLRGPIRGDMCDVFLMWQIMTRFTSVSTETVIAIGIVTLEYGSTRTLAHLLISLLGYSQRYIWSHPKEEFGSPFDPRRNMWTIMNLPGMFYELPSFSPISQPGNSYAPPSMISSTNSGSPYGLLSMIVWAPFTFLWTLETID